MVVGAFLQRGITGPARAAIAPVAVLVGVMWAAEILDTAVGGRLDSYGIEPREADGLPGVVTAPFLHAGFGHLIANTTALLVLGFLLAITTKQFWQTSALLTVLGGFAVWLVGPAGTEHIGASGLVYGIAAYLVARGLLERRIVGVLVAVVVVVLYGGMVLGVLPGQPSVSWQSHLFGALAGVGLAWVAAIRARRSRAVRLL